MDHHGRWANVSAEFAGRVDPEIACWLRCNVAKTVSRSDLRRIVRCKRNWSGVSGLRERSEPPGSRVARQRKASSSATNLVEVILQLTWLRSSSSHRTATLRARPEYLPHRRSRTGSRRYDRRATGCSTARPLDARCRRRLIPTRSDVNCGVCRTGTNGLRERSPRRDREVLGKVRRVRARLTWLRSSRGHSRSYPLCRHLLAIHPTTPPTTARCTYEPTTTAPPTAAMPVGVQGQW